MTDLSTYKPTKYKDIQAELVKRKDDAKIHELKLAAKINIKAVSTVRKAFNPKEQITSDGLFTKVCSALGMNVMVGWTNGERNYFISQ